MTLEELHAIKRYLNQLYTYEQRLGQVDIQDYKKAKDATEREIRVKEMDPRKTDVQGQLMDGD